MKLLIIAGPYEADRLRKSAVAAGFEAVAVEPGESLSGWITASRPQLIVMAPQMVHPDPALAIAKVRSVPRGRVPIFLVGDESDEPMMAALSEGFFVRPVSPEALLAHAKAVLAAERAREQTNLGLELPRSAWPVPGKASGPAPTPTPSAEAAAPAKRRSVTSGGPVTRSSGTGGGSRPAMSLKPLVAAAAVPAAPSQAAARPATNSSALLAQLDAGIDALLDAELDDALAAAPRPVAPAAPEPAKPAPVVKDPLEFSSERTADMKVPDLASMTAPAAPSNGTANAGAAVVAPLEDRRARILSHYTFVTAGDYFHVLGLTREATAADAESAHAALLRELDSETLGETLAGELRSQIEAIREVAGEALRILKDERLRQRYRAHLPS
jgi:hypothetical protein